MSIVSKVDSSLESYALFSMSVMGRNGAIVSWFSLVVCRLIYSVSSQIQVENFSKIKPAPKLLMDKKLRETTYM